MHWQRQLSLFLVKPLDCKEQDSMGKSIFPAERKHQPANKELVHFRNSTLYKNLILYTNCKRNGIGCNFAGAGTGGERALISKAVRSSCSPLSLGLLQSLHLRPLLCRAANVRPRLRLHSIQPWTWGPWGDGTNRATADGIRTFSHSESTSGEKGNKCTYQKISNVNQATVANR